jgi:hypothetical protein
MFDKRHVMDLRIGKPINEPRMKIMSKNINLATVSFAVALAVALSGALFFGLSAVVGAQGPEGGISAQSPVGTAFTYQGRLNDGGSPANGIYDFLFYMYDAQSDGNFLSNYGVPNLAVSDGYFTVQLNYGSGAFTGEARWLEILVRESGQADYTTLSPRVPLLAVPYAHSLRPGAEVNTTGRALYLSTSATSDSALYANASASSGNPAAVYGAASAPQGAGISGYNSSSGYGVYGGSNHGHGVYGGSNYGYGVYGKSNTFDGIGVYGEGTGLAIYSNGDTHIEGGLTWKPITGYVSVSAAAFRPASHSYQYDNTGQGLTPMDPASTHFYAPVQLPHGATVTKMTFYWIDDMTANAVCQLFRNPLSGVELTVMADVESGSGGRGSTSDDTIDGVLIDNSQYTYYLHWDLREVDIWGIGVVIEYTFTTPY